MNAAQAHLALNHLPIIGTLIGFGVLAGGLALRWPQVRRTGLAVLAFAAVATIPTFLSGEPAEEHIENMTGVLKSRIHDHEEAGEFAIILSSLAGAAAALSLIAARMKREKPETWLARGALALALLFFLTLARTGHLGGLIRHPELESAQETGSR
jgi:hypothetical protein